MVKKDENCYFSPVFCSWSLEPHFGPLFSKHIDSESTFNPTVNLIQIQKMNATKNKKVEIFISKLTHKCILT